MSDFNTLCKKFENSDPDALRDIMSRKLESVYNTLIALPEKNEAVDTFGKFVMCLMLADNDFSQGEYDIIKARMDISSFTDMTYEEMRAFMTENGLDNPEECEKVIKSMVGIMGRLSEFDREDAALCAFMVCGIDGNVSENEKAILKRILN